jgi:DNA-binding winged helix-turn-helix (wHTH) protein/predicted ATPase
VKDERRIQFDPFALDLTNECLWKGAETIRLRPKAFAVLQHLLTRPGQLVTKNTLLDAVWGDAFVGEAVLKVTIRQIREALSDDPRKPRFIETSHRRGYRFIGQIGNAALAPSVPTVAEPPRGLVGRDAALARMRAWLDAAQRGERQIVFVSGEAGIGKTTLVDAFVRGPAADSGLLIATGQCLEQYGTSEAYLPVLEAVSQLCRDHPAVVEVLRTHAPMWLLQMPSLVTSSDRETFGSEAFGASRERMLREMGEALEALSAQAPLVLVLEDLHWSDFSTLDLISYLAHQRRAARLMVVGTYRPAELIASGHPLKAVKRELAAKQQCEELVLEYLDEDAVAEYLAVRFPGHRFPGALAALVHDRTEGNPLFMVNTIDYLVAEGLVSQQPDGWEVTAELDRIKLGVPDSIRNLIEKQIDHLDATEQRTLEAASVAGAEFSHFAVAAGLDEGAAAVQATCDALARRHQFLHESGVQTLPNGDVAGRFGFVHAVYRSVLYERISAARRVLLHRRLAERAEQVWGDRAAEIAGELAMHFERATNHDSAARYLQQAAEIAMRRSAYREAVALSRHGLELLAKLPDTGDRARRELQLNLRLGVPLVATEGYAADVVGVVFTKARELCERLGDPPETAQALWGLWTFRILRAELEPALEIAREFVRLPERLSYPGMAMRGDWALGITFTHSGDFARAVVHLEKALVLYEPDQHRDDAFLYGLNPASTVRCFEAWALWFIGRPNQAVVRVHEAVAIARDLSEPHGLAHALSFASVMHQLCREPDAALEYANATIEVSREHGLALYHAMGEVVRAWALIVPHRNEEVLPQLRRGMVAWERTGARLMWPHILGLLADALVSTSRGEEALGVLDEAIGTAEMTGECNYRAELYRLKGELLRTREGAAAAAEASFLRALAIAREQQALSIELRSAMSLARLAKEQGLAYSAGDLVRPILTRFTEGFDTPDLRDARVLVESEAKS